jgi:hypothetical protein
VAYSVVLESSRSDFARAVSFPWFFSRFFQIVGRQFKISREIVGNFRGRSTSAVHLPDGKIKK